MLLKSLLINFNLSKFNYIETSCSFFATGRKNTEWVILQTHETQPWFCEMVIVYEEYKG